MSPRKYSYTNLPRRQSPRLKGLSNAKNSEDTPKPNINSTINGVKCEVLDHGEMNEKEESNCETDVSLRDLRALCRAKRKRKVLEESGNNVKTIDEESDLDEPIIILKVKRAKSSPSKKGQAELEPRLSERNSHTESDLSPISSVHDSNTDTCTGPHVKTESINTCPDVIELIDCSTTDNSDSIYNIKSESSDTDVLTEPDPTEISPPPKDSIAKLDSCETGSVNLPLLPCSFNDSCSDQNNFGENKETEKLDFIEHITSNHLAENSNPNGVITQDTGAYSLVHDFLCDETSDFLSISNFGSKDGELESVVYDAIATYVQKNTDETTSNSCVTNIPLNQGSLNSESELSCVVGQDSITQGVTNSENNCSGEACKETNQQESCVNFDEGGTEMKREETDDEGHAPRKLLSNRKIISPTSQEKLCHALTGIDLCDRTEITRTKKRMLFQDYWSKSKKSSSPPDKLKTEPKGNPKPLENSTGGSSCNCKRGPAFQMDTDKAVEFSQRQIHDIENIASKLLENMKFMKSVVDESLQREPTSFFSKFSIDEIRAASENAMKLERMTKKWLSMMTKDCHRFCKILRLAGNNNTSSSSPSKSVNNKERRKIIFADEAGGVLCHVRVLNDQQSLLL